MSQEGLETYHGSCHCGNFTFSVTVPEIKTGKTCNCSICFRKGYLWLRLDPQQFKADEGTGTLVSYYAPKGSKSHLFCATCGTGVMATKEEDNAMAVNMNTFKDFNRKDLEIIEFDGRSFGEPYQTFNVPTEALNLLDVPQDYKTYTGHCHCGAVKIAFKSPDLYLPSTLVVLDNCSICTINAYIVVYPEHKHTAITGIENTNTYYMGQKWAAHRFCKTCGVSVYIDSSAGPPPHVLETLADAVKAKLSTYPVNLRCIKGLDWKELGILKME